MICRSLPPYGRAASGPGWSRAWLQHDRCRSRRLLLPTASRWTGDLHDRHAGGVEAQDDRRLHARRHDCADRLGDAVTCATATPTFAPWLEEDLDDGHAVERLRLDVLDVVDVAADRVFAEGGDALLELLGVMPL